LDNQTIFNVLVSALGVLALWILNGISNKIKDLEDDNKELPHYYVSKEDYRSDISDIKQMLNKIFDRLDAKVDK
jgi:hypothetical protein